MNWSLLASSYGAVFGNVQVLLMTFLGALGGVQVLEGDDVHGVTR